VAIALGKSSQKDVDMQVLPLGSLYSTLPVDGWRRVENYLKNVVAKPQSVDYVTPFFPKDKRNDALGYGQEILRRFGTTKFPLLNDLELSASEKFGPFSIRLPYGERLESISLYFSQKKVEKSSVLERATELVAGQLPKASLKALALDDSYANMPPGTNLGLPYFSRMAEHRKLYLDRARLIHTNGYKDDVYPSVLGWRGQPNGTSVPKQRTVWMFDHCETIIGLSIQIPVLSALKNLPGYSAWNDLEVVDRAITRMIDRAKGLMLSVDFSSFDASAPRVLIEAAFNVLRHWFERSAWSRINWLERQFLTVGLVGPEGILHGRDGGVPSGSALTNLIDTLVQKILWHVIGLVLGVKVLDAEHLGDDGVISFVGEPNIDEMSDAVNNLFGMKVSADKGGASGSSVQFLQRLHMRDYRINGLCRGIRTVCRTWNGVIHQERIHEDLPAEFFSSRAIMQLEQLKWHLNYRKVVYYYYTLDKFAREMDAVTIFRRSGGAKKVEEVLGLTSFRVGEELPSEGLKSFFTVRLLDEFRRKSGASKAA